MSRCLGKAGCCTTTSCTHWWSVSRSLSLLLKRRTIDGWATAGFAVDFSKDGSELYRKYSTRGSGYYIDVGFSQLIIDGKINIKQSLEGITGFEKHSLILAEGSRLDADIVVLQQGMDNMRTSARNIMGNRIVDRCKDVRDMDDKRESIAVPDPVLCNSLSLASVWC